MAVSYQTDIKDLFREKHRNVMLNKRHFDLWLYDDVVKWADKIKDQVENGDMPCDRAWPDERVALFDQWITDGKLP